MIVRRHVSGQTRSAAQYSDCGAFRYRLSRDWADDPRLLFLLLNPSTASEERNDATVERCERRARAMGFGGFEVVNLFAFRATRPADLRRAADPVGRENDAAIGAAARGAGMILCGWGMHGLFQARGQVVERMLRVAGHPLWRLGATAGGHPRHPLYVAYAVQPQLWAEENAEN